MIDEEQRLVLPWLVIPLSEESKLFKLLVSSPDGQVLEFPISKDAAENLPQFLSDAGLWGTFFTSLINSLEMRSV